MKYCFFPILGMMKSHETLFQIQGEISRCEESLWWLVSINLTSRQIIHFTSGGDNSQNFGHKTNFKPTRYLYEPPILQINYVKKSISF